MPMNYMRDQIRANLETSLAARATTRRERITENQIKHAMELRRQGLSWADVGTKTGTSAGGIKYAVRRREGTKYG